MYTSLKIKKQTGTYSDTIEAFGVANLVDEIFSRNDISRNKIDIEDKGLYYEIIPKPEIPKEMIKSLTYFPLFKYVIRKEGETFEEVFFDYPKQREFKKERQDLINKVHQDLPGKENAKERELELKKINKIYEEEKCIHHELDVYSQIITPNNFVGFNKLYDNLRQNKENFTEIIKAILDYYLLDKRTELKTKTLNSFSDSLTALQIYNPTTGKGLNKGKASGASPGPIKLNWISETMKISGALSNMLCQLIKVGSSYDLKVVVPDFKMADYTKQKRITVGFKKNIKGNTPLKVDILNLLLILKKLIENTDEFNRFKAKNILSGLHSTYQKDLGNNKAVVNIAKLQTPDFIEFDTEDEAKDWIEILDEQIRIIGSIDELGDATQGLLSYRTFLTSSHFESWINFVFWYSGYIISNLSKNKYTLPFRISTLNKFFKNISMEEFKISEIISNEGFQKVADAIRNSTVILQGAKSRGQKIFFEVRYGVAQELKNKSKTSADLATFIGDFIGTYNAETARKSELNKAYRKPLRDNELNQFYTLLDNYPSKVVGALLASYGFALTEKDIDEEESKNENELPETN